MIVSADDAACTCQPEGGLPHNEVPYDYGYDDPADCPVHGKAASAASGGRPPVANYRLFVSEDGKTFVRFWSDDKTVEVATRDNSWETWGPPVRCVEER